MKKILFVFLVVMMGLFVLQGHVSAMMDEPESTYLVAGEPRLDPDSIEQAKLDTLNILLDRVSVLLEKGIVDARFNEKRKMATFCKEPFTLFIVRKDLREWDQGMDPPDTSKTVYDIEVYKSGAESSTAPPLLKMENYYFQENNRKSKEIYVKAGLLYMEVYAKFLKKKNLEYRKKLEQLKTEAFYFIF